MKGALLIHSIREGDVSCFTVWLKVIFINYTILTTIELNSNNRTTWHCQDNDDDVDDDDDDVDDDDDKDDKDVDDDDDDDDDKDDADDVDDDYDMDSDEC